MKLPDAEALDLRHRILSNEPLPIYAPVNDRVIPIGIVRMDDDTLDSMARAAVLDERHEIEFLEVLQAAKRVVEAGQSAEEIANEQVQQLLSYLAISVAYYVRFAVAAFDPDGRIGLTLHAFISQMLRTVRFCRHCHRVFLRERRAQAFCSDACEAEALRVRERSRSRASYMNGRRREEKIRTLTKAVLRNARARQIGKPADIAAGLKHADPHILEAVERLAIKDDTISEAFSRFSARRSVTRRSSPRRSNKR